MKSRKQIIADVLKDSLPKFDITVLTDAQLNDLEQVMKRNGLHFISIEKAVQNGFIVPDNPEEIINQLIKFYNEQN